MLSIDTIIKQSPWLLDPAKINEDVHLVRLKAFSLIYHESSFLDYSFEDGVYVVTGPRQIGKSTHLKLLIKKLITEKNHRSFLYFNCDLLDNKQQIAELVELYLQKFPSKHRYYIFLDEVTSVKDSFMAIKFLVDSGFNKNITYILTGSSSVNVKKTGEYLPGRRGKGVDFYFNPLSFQSFVNLIHPDVKFKLTLASSELEFIKINQKIDLKKLLRDYLITGGFPRVINEYYSKKNIGDDIFTIYRTWLTSEIAKSDKKEYIAKRILDRTLISLGSDISYNSFTQDTGVGSHNTIFDYIDFFVNSFVLTQIYNFDIHQKKINFKKNKKIYFNDPFIYSVIDAWLTGKPVQDYSYIKDPILCLQIIENLVLIYLSSVFRDVYFYQGNYEIDFVMDPYLIEVKYKNKILTSDYKFPEDKHYKKILITKNEFKKEKDLLMIPIEYFLMLNSDTWT